MIRSDDGGGEPGVVEGPAHSGEGAFLALGQDLEEEFRAARVEMPVAQPVEAEQVERP